MPKKNRNQRPADYLKVTDPKGFIQLPNSTILSDEFNSLKYSTRCLYLTLLTRWKRHKDKAEKEFPFSYRELQKTLKMDRRVIANAIIELEEFEFITVTRHWNNTSSTYRMNTKWLT